jgi:hypothetical protein
MVLPIGCGDSERQESSIPKDFGEKLEKERPDLFVKKTGKGKTAKTEVLGGRDKRAVVREEYLKSQQGTQ